MPGNQCGANQIHPQGCFQVALGGLHQLPWLTHTRGIDHHVQARVNLPKGVEESADRCFLGQVANKALDVGPGLAQASYCLIYPHRGATGDREPIAELTEPRCNRLADIARAADNEGYLGRLAHDSGSSASSRRNTVPVGLRGI